MAGQINLNPRYLRQALNEDSVVIFMTGISNGLADYYCIKGSENIIKLKDVLTHNLNKSSWETISKITY